MLLIAHPLHAAPARLDRRRAEKRRIRPGIVGCRRPPAARTFDMDATHFLSCGSIDELCDGAGSQGTARTGAYPVTVSSPSTKCAERAVISPDRAVHSDRTLVFGLGNDFTPARRGRARPGSEMTRAAPAASAEPEKEAPAAGSWSLRFSPPPGGLWRSAPIAWMARNSRCSAMTARIRAVAHRP